MDMINLHTTMVKDRATTNYYAKLYKPDLSVFCSMTTIINTKLKKKSELQKLLSKSDKISNLVWML